MGYEKFRTIGGEIIIYKYLKTVHNHYHHRYNVDLHITRCQAPIDWRIHGSQCDRKPCFAFFDISDGNDNLGEHNFGGVETVRPMMYFGIIFLGNSSTSPTLVKIILHRKK